MTRAPRKTTPTPAAPATDSGAVSSGELAFPQLVELCRGTHQSLQAQASRAIDSSMVLRNWLFGCYIVEFEQKGVDRAEYGQKLIPRLASELGYIKGVNPTALRKSRAFYLAYSEIQPTLSVESCKIITSNEMSDNLSISATLSRKSEKVSRISSNSISDKLMPIRQTLSAALLARFRLGWSHYVTLLSISNPDERSFYEIETEANGWSVRELERQIGSSLYERLALSGDKNGPSLAPAGQPADSPGCSPRNEGKPWVVSQLTAAPKGRPESRLDRSSTILNAPSGLSVFCPVTQGLLLHRYTLGYLPAAPLGRKLQHRQPRHLKAALERFEHELEGHPLNS